MTERQMAVIIYVFCAFLAVEAIATWIIRGIYPFGLAVAITIVGVTFVARYPERTRDK